MRTFLTIWFGQSVSAIGSELTSFALGVWVYLETGSTTLFALNILIFTLPGILFSPFIGSVVDRADRRSVMIGSDFGAGLTTLAIWLIFLYGGLAVWHVYAATFLNATFNSFQWTAHSATTSSIVTKEQLGRASGLAQMSGAISMLIGPALGGALFVSVGLGGIALIDLITFCIAIGTLLIVRIPRPIPSKVEVGSGRTLIDDAALGWRYISARPGLLSLLLYFASLYFIVGMVDPLLGPMLLEMSDPETMGAVLSTMGAGYLGGTLLLSIWGGPRRRILGILLVGVLQGVVIIGFGASRSIGMIAAALFLFSLLDPIVGGSSQAFWQTKIPADLQGRVFAVRRMTSRIGLALSLMVAGPLAERFFEPLLLEGGNLANSIGTLVGVGRGRGTGLLFIILGLFFSLSSIAGLIYTPLRCADVLIPDAATDPHSAHQL
jgi:sugar phosphate permease